MVERAESTFCSSASMVLMIMAFAVDERAAPVTTKSSKASFGSVVWMTKLQKSFRRIGIIPGTQSISVSIYPFVK